MARARGPRPTEPRAAQVRYLRMLRRIVARLHARVREEVIPLLDAPNQQAPGSVQGVIGVEREDAISGRVARKLRQIEIEIGGLVVDVGVETELTAVATAVSRHSVTTVRRLTGISLRQLDPSVAGAVPGFINTNTALIQKMGTDQLRKVEQIISAGATSGAGSGDIAQRLAARAGVDLNRAKLIARDQVLTLNAQVTQARHQRIGITHYFWNTSGDEVVRGNKPSDSMDHASLNGQRFAYDNPPPDPRDGVTAHPGERIHCRCVAIPDTASLIDPGEAA